MTCDLLMLALISVVIPATWRLDAWSGPLFGVILLFTVGSDLTAVDVPGLLWVSGSFLGLVLAAVVLGGGPAAILGVIAISAGWFQSREPLKYFINNIANYALFPFAAGLCFRLVTHVAHLTPHNLAYYLLVFATFVFALG
ncbi:MAG TPA: hypothetical protein VFN87_20280, partial [Solirubrobacteraceae bacterium]|nr:hypothetical protein [Solirubrobacteraceae bacterium]